MGRLTRNTLRQPKALMSSPPTAGPRAGAANSTTPALAGMPRVRSPPRAGPRMRLIASGTIGAPARPCTTLAAMSSATPGTRAHAADARVKASRAPP